MEQGKNYINGSMNLIYLERVNDYYIFYRLNDNSYVLTDYIVSIDSKNNSISWLNGSYMVSLVGVYELLKFTKGE